MTFQLPLDNEYIRRGNWLDKTVENYLRVKQILERREQLDKWYKLEPNLIKLLLKEDFGSKTNHETRLQFWKSIYPFLKEISHIKTIQSDINIKTRKSSKLGRLDFIADYQENTYIVELTTTKYIKGIDLDLDHWQFDYKRMQLAGYALGVRQQENKVIPGLLVVATPGGTATEELSGEEMKFYQQVFLDNN